MDYFREYYITSIVPQLKSIEEERKILENKITQIIIITSLIVTPIVIYFVVKTNNYNFAFLFSIIPMPVTFFLNELIKGYSKKYKETVIKNLFLSYFDSYTIEPENKLAYNTFIEYGLISSKRNIGIDTEDFISLTHKDNKIHIHEILIKEISGNHTQVIFKGILCSMDFKKNINQSIILRNQATFENKNNDLKNFKSVDFNNVRVFYQETFDNELIKPFIDFISKERISMSIMNRKIYCLISADNISFRDDLELFEPALTFKYNSNYTYTLVRSEYYRIRKFSNLLMKLEEINVN